MFQNSIPKLHTEFCRKMYKIFPRWCTHLPGPADLVGKRALFMLQLIQRGIVKLKWLGFCYKEHFNSYGFQSLFYSKANID